MIDFNVSDYWDYFFQEFLLGIPAGALYEVPPGFVSGNSSRSCSCGFSHAFPLVPLGDLLKIEKKNKKKISSFLCGFRCSFRNLVRRSLCGFFYEFHPGVPSGGLMKVPSCSSLGVTLEDSTSSFFWRFLQDMSLGIPPEVLSGNYFRSFL